MLTQFPVFTLILQLLLLYPDAVLSDIDGDWEYCPTNITVYRYCNATIYAIFNTTSHMCNEVGFVYHIFIRHSDSNNVNDFKKFGPEDPVPPVVIDETTGNHSRCNISETSAVNQPAGVYDIKFQFVSNVPVIITRECYDTLFIEDSVPPPVITSTNITCKGVLIKWEGPSLAEGYNIVEYILTVSGTTITYTISATNDSTHLIPYKDGLEYDKEYNISVTAVYCGGMGNTTTTTVYTALAPVIEDDPDIKDCYTSYNSSHGHIYKTFKVTAIDCEVSHPKMATIDLNCSSHFVWDNHSMSQPVTARYDDTVIVDIILPVDSHCLVALSFNNEILAKHLTSSLDINTNQLHSCSSSVNGDVVVSCTFSRFSSLWGCRVELTSTTDRNETTHIDIAALKSYERFFNVCNGVYMMKCYGLERINQTSATGDRTTTMKVIDYGDDGFHSSGITVESGYHCGNTTMATTTTIVTPTTTIVTRTPSIEPIRTDDQQCTIITVPLAMITIVFLVISVTAIIYICIRKKQTPRIRLQTTEPGEARRFEMAANPRTATALNDDLNPHDEANNEDPHNEENETDSLITKQSGSGNTHSKKGEPQQQRSEHHSLEQVPSGIEKEFTMSWSPLDGRSRSMSLPTSKRPILSRSGNNKWTTRSRSRDLETSEPLLEQTDLPSPTSFPPGKDDHHSDHSTVISNSSTDGVINEAEIEQDESGSSEELSDPSPHDEPLTPGNGDSVLRGNKGPFRK